MTKTTKNTLKLLILLIGALFIGHAEAGEKILHPIKIVKEFEKLTSVKVIGTMKFFMTNSIERYDPNAAAVCQTKFDKNGDVKSRKIVISRQWWNGNKTNEQRTMLIFHELGHCALGLTHHHGVENHYDYDTETVVECPKTLMAPVVFSKKQSKQCFGKNKKKYIQGLFELVNKEIRDLKKKLRAAKKHNHDH